MSRWTSFLSLGNKYCASPVGEDPGSEVKAESRSIHSFLPCSSLETPHPYLEIEESAVAPVNGLCGATGPRDPDDVDLQGGRETVVNAEAASPGRQPSTPRQPLHRQGSRAKHQGQRQQDLGLTLSSAPDQLYDLGQATRPLCDPASSSVKWV